MSFLRSWCPRWNATPFLARALQGPYKFLHEQCNSEQESLFSCFSVLTTPFCYGLKRTCTDNGFLLVWNSCLSIWIWTSNSQRTIWGHPCRRKIGTCVLTQPYSVKRASMTYKRSKCGLLWCKSSEDFEEIVLDLLNHFETMYALFKTRKISFWFLYHIISLGKTLVGSKTGSWFEVNLRNLWKFLRRFPGLRSSLVL